MDRRRLLITLVLGALLLLAGALLLGMRGGTQNQSPAAAAPIPAETLVRFHSPVIGAPGARATIVEFFDPACEACRAFYPYVKEILARHPADTRLVLRYTPFHGEISLEGVRILEAARAQALFEPVLEALLAAQDQWASHGAPSAARAWELAGAAGLDIPAARALAATGAAERMLEQDLADAKALAISATPTFFVNGRRLAEPVPRVLLEMVESALAE